MSNGDDSLPSSWALTSLQELLLPLEGGRLLHHGWSPQCEKGPSTATSEWGVLKTTAVQDGKFIDEHNKRLPDHLRPRPQFEVKQGDILITCAGPRARCGVVSLVRHTRPRLILSGKMYRFRSPEPMVDPRYLEGFLRAPEAQSAIDRMKTGINDSGLNLTHSRFLPLPVRLAPCREQVRIVEALDSYFSRLDDAEATLERAKRNLERYRASVLQAAVEGRLMGADTRSAWPEFTGLATERVYQNRMELPVGWRWARVGEIGQVKGGKRLPAGAEYSPSPTAHPYLRVCDFTDGTISHANLRFLPSAVAAALSRYTISKNDVYISIAGTIGLAGTVPEDLDGANLTENAAKICNLRSVLPKFLAIVLSSPFGQRQIAEKTIATTLSKLALYRIETVGLPLPPLVEQERITQEVERLESIQASSTGCVGKFHSRAAELRRSLLTIAFKGRLVVQDSTDEPASVLLERIRAERAKAASSHETPRHRARPRKAVKK